MYFKFFDNLLFINNVVKIFVGFFMQVLKLYELVDFVIIDYEKYFFNEVGRVIYDFFWSDFVDWYEIIQFLKFWYNVF